MLRQDGSSRCADASLFAGLEAAPALLLAVSGGPDSLGLMLLAASWSAALGCHAPRLHVATVDHGLRPDSGAEACGVAAAAGALGLSHVTLPWLGPKPVSRLQERARAVRYGLLGAHAATLGVRHLLTGHHADDQAETVLLRLGRGSGIAGLAGMRRETVLGPHLTLVRPLLGMTKAALIALCREAGQAVVDDPSNRNPAFARARLRALAPATAALGLDTPNLLRLAARAARAEAALEAETRRCLTLIDLPDGAVPLTCRLAPPLTGRLAPPPSARLAPPLNVRLAPLGDLPEEILIRILRIALGRAVPNGPAPRLDRLETLAAALSAALRDRRPLRSTLNGARVTLGRDTMLRIEAEAPRRRGRLVAVP